MEWHQIVSEWLVVCAEIRLRAVEKDKCMVHCTLGRVE